MDVFERRFVLGERRQVLNALHLAPVMNTLTESKLPVKGQSLFWENMERLRLGQKETLFQTQLLLPTL